MEVLSPETIAGVQAVLDERTWRLEYEGDSLNAGALSEEEIEAKKALAEIVANLQERGYAGGKVRIDHCRNENAAQALKEAILTAWPQAEVVVSRTRALCSYYAEEGGVLVGFESA